MNKDLDTLLSQLRDSVVECELRLRTLREFYKEHHTSRDFSSVSSETCQDVIEVLSETLEEASSKNLNTSPVFEVVLILTRNSQCQNMLLNKFLKILLHHSVVMQDPEKSDKTISPELDSRLAAVKCLCNIVFQSQSNRDGIDALKNNDFENHLGKHIVTVLNEDKLKEYSMDLMFFDFMLFFLYTAIANDARRYLIDYPGMKGGLIFGIDFLITLMKKDNDTNANSAAASSTSHANVLGNMLKTLYTLLAGLEQRICGMENLDNATNDFYESLTVACRDILLLTDVSSPKSFTDGDLLSHTYSVLGIIPSSVLKSAFLEMNDKQSEEYVVTSNAEVFAKLFRALKTVATIHENSTVKITLFLALCNLSRSCKVLRKHMREKILPPRKDVHIMPQEGQELKNDLVRMMTGVNREIGELVSEFLFVLCKENVDRLLKYTGYGNAAGMMFTRGLGLRSPQPADYSEDEDTDTEEFKGHQHGFNYVTGLSSQYFLRRTKFS